MKPGVYTQLLTQLIQIQRFHTLVSILILQQMTLISQLILSEISHLALYYVSLFVIELD